MKVCSLIKLLKNCYCDCQVVKCCGCVYVINKIDLCFKVCVGQFSDFEFCFMVVDEYEFVYFKCVGLFFLELVMIVKVVLWDLGNVLIDWQFVQLYCQYFDDEVEFWYFFDNVCNMDWYVYYDCGVFMVENCKFLIV